MASGARVVEMDQNNVEVVGGTPSHQLEVVMIEHSLYQEKPFHRSCSNCNDCEKSVICKSYVGSQKKKKGKYDLNLPKNGVRTDYKYFCKRHKDDVKENAVCQCWNAVLGEDGNPVWRNSLNEIL